MVVLVVMEAIEAMAVMVGMREMATIWTLDRGGEDSVAVSVGVGVCILDAGGSTPGAGKRVAERDSGEECNRLNNG